MKGNLRKIIEPILGYGAVTLFILAIISLIAILGVGLMRLFGFEYNSVGSVILYFIIVVVVGFPIDTLTKVFPKVLASFYKINKKTEKMIFILLDTIGTAIVMSVVDYFMDSVYVSDLTILIVSFIIAILSLDKD